jgi:hypothetical protein
VSLMGVVHQSLGLTMLFLVLSALFLEVRGLRRSCALCRVIIRVPLRIGRPPKKQPRVSKVLCQVLAGCASLGCASHHMPWLLPRACGEAVRWPLSAAQAMVLAMRHC